MIVTFPTGDIGANESLSINYEHKLGAILHPEKGLKNFQTDFFYEAPK